MTDEEVEETLKDGFYQYYNKQVDARTEAQKRILDDLGMMPQGFGEKLAFSAGSLPVDLVRYLPAIALTRNPAYALALTDAYFASEEGPVEAAKAGAKGFIIGKTLQWAGPLAWHQRVPIGAGMGYVLTPGELEDRLVGATLFGGMSLLPTGRKNANTIIRDIERKRQKYGEHNQTLVERVQGKPKDEAQANNLINALRRDISEGESAVKKGVKSGIGMGFFRGGYSGYGGIVHAGEFVIDADSTRALERQAPGFLSALNKAKGSQINQVLETYMSYGNEGEGTETLIPLPFEKVVTRTVAVGGGSQDDGDFVSPFMDLYRRG